MNPTSPNHALQRTAPCAIPAGRDFHRRLSTHHAGAAPHSAVAELGVVRRLPHVTVNRAFQILLVCGSLLIFASCATQSEFTCLYDHYFPKRTEYVQGIYRRGYDRWMFGNPPPKLDSTRYNYLYQAFHGDAASFHSFLHHPDRDVAGEPGESWHYDCLLLLIRLGDSRFSELLARETTEARMAVGYAIDPQVDWTLHQFPKTRAMYSYRYVRKPT